MNARASRRTTRSTAAALALAGVVTWLAMAIALGACSSPTAASAASTAMVDENVTPRASNPEGVPYPTENLGRTPRRGSTRGSRIPNLAFRGYVDSDKAAGLKDVSLADYFDPSGAKYKVIHLMAAASWCPYCKAQSKEMVATAAALRGEGVVILQVLVNGPSQGKGPTLGDLGAWIDLHKTTFTVLVDSNGRKLSEVATLSAVPWNALVDARTMEILDADLGVPPDFAKYARWGLAAAAATPR